MAAPAESTRDGVEPAVRVSTLELFFDLVFVFTITQLTDDLAHDLEWERVGEVLLMLAIIWWMYSGYAWLTNAVAPTSTTRRTLLLAGMAGFLIIALSIPEAFHDNGWAFGTGYLIVNIVHGALFLRAAGPAVGRAAATLAPLNLLSAALVFVGGLLPEDQRFAWWGASLFVQVATPYLHRLRGFTINAGHFVERHGLVMIIVIGESIVSIGLGFAGVDLDFASIVVALLGLSVAYYFWWGYFVADEERSAGVLAAITDPRRKAQMALWAWGYAHYPMIFGIVLFSAGIKKTIPYAFDPLDWATAAALAVGAATFLVGHAIFLMLLGLRGVPHRLLAAALVLLTIFIGRLDATGQLVTILTIMSVAMIIEDLPQIIRSRSTNLGSFGR